jgi:hypothetical protein
MPTPSSPVREREREREREKEGGRERLYAVFISGRLSLSLWFVHEHQQAESAGVPLRTSAVDRKRATVQGREREREREM